MAEDACRHALRRDLGTRLRTARERTGFSQAGAAVALGIPRQSINRIEAGLRGLDVLELVELARLYRERPSEFLASEHSTQPGSELEQLSRGLSRRDYERLLSLARAMHRKRLTAKEKTRPA
jgi:transcriptional regulator with XRE-family HTH domain